MKRETTNKIRFLIEECVPPVLRDAWPMKLLFRAYWGEHVDTLEDFRKRAPFLTEQEYKELYEIHPRVHEDTDNSQACLDKIKSVVVGDSICDVGCGTGYTLRSVSHPGLSELVGVDIVIDRDICQDTGNLSFREAYIENLPFADQQFDTVICTHVLEHTLDIRQAVAELRRITRKRLILVVPREREYLFNFNPHFHFFPYPHSFLRYLIPIPENWHCEDVERDIFYYEDVPAP